MDIVSRIFGFLVVLLFVGLALWVSFVIFSMLAVPLFLVLIGWWGWNFLIRKGIINPPKGQQTVWQTQHHSSFAEDGSKTQETITVIETDYRHMDGD